MVASGQKSDFPFATLRQDGENGRYSAWMGSCRERKRPAVSAGKKMAEKGDGAHKDPFRKGKPDETVRTCQPAGMLLAFLDKRRKIPVADESPEIKTANRPPGEASFEFGTSLQVAFWHFGQS